MMKQVLVPTVVIGALFSTAPAHAQTWPTADPNFTGSQTIAIPTADKFGQPGQVVIASDFHVDFGYESTKQSGVANTGATTIRLAPAVDYFVVRNVAVGGVAGLTFEKTTPSDVSARTLELGPEVGYAAMISPRVTLFPKVGVAYRNVDISGASPLGGTISHTESHVALKAALPILVHPFEHLFLGAGPILDFDVLSRSGGQAGAKNTSITLSFIIGGWF